MKKTVAQSLLPLLGSGSSEIKLAISTHPEETSQGNQGSKNPFLIITDGHPLAAVIAGTFISESESPVKKVFLAVQKDDYRTLHQTHRPLTNGDVDRIWQESFLYHQRHNPDFFITLPSQTDSDLNLQAYKPLFYCDRTHRFFHPPCPVCANQLEQCYEDDVLSKAGLESYINTINRYLYCPHCFSSKGETTFYVYESHASDPPAVNDRWHLLNDFSRLVEGDFDPETLPCFTCQHVIECYGTGPNAAKHITPFAFYNFFLFIHAAPSLHPMDFLALAAGATPAELNNVLVQKREFGRLTNIQTFFPNDNANFSFLFAHNDNWPVEVLFLKINFLTQLLAAVKPLLGKQKYPDLVQPIDQFWIKIAVYDKHLPFCWNFKTIPIGPGFTGASTDNNHLPPPVNNELFNMAQTWFFALFFNKIHTIKDIQATLAGLLDDQALHDFTVFEQNASSGTIQLLEPKNILWDPGTADNVDFLRPFLVRALKFGWSIFRASYNLESDWSVNSFTQEVDGFAEELKTILLQVDSKSSVLTASVDQASTRESPEDNAIKDILNHMLDRWEKAPVPSTTPDQEDIDRTQILSPDTRPDAQDHGAESSAEYSETEEIMATRIMQRPETEQKKPAQTYEEPGLHDDLTETRILTPDQKDTRTDQEQPVSHPPPAAG